MNQPTLADLSKTRQQTVRRVLTLLIGVDLFWIVLNGAWGLGAMLELFPGRPVVLMLDRDFGLPESWNFLKWIAAAAMLLSLPDPASRHMWRPVGLAMLVMLADDALMLHERTGEALVAAFPNLFAGALQGFSELFFIALMGIMVFGLLFLAFLRAPDNQRGFVRTFILLFLMLAVFGVLIDLIHSIFHNLYHSRLIGQVFAMIEDGGELIVISLIAAHGLRVRLANGRHADSAMQRPQ